MKRYERMIYFAAVVVIMLGFPVFFRRYPFLRFYWGIIAAVGVGIQVYYSLMRNRMKASKAHIHGALLVLSVCMAYDVVRWEVFVSLFPAAADVPPLKVVLLIFLVMAGGGIAAASLSKVLGFLQRRGAGRRVHTASAAARDSRRKSRNSAAGSGNCENSAGSENCENSAGSGNYENSAGSGNGENPVDSGKAANPADGTAEGMDAAGGAAAIVRAIGWMFGILLMTAVFIGAAYVSVRNEEVLNRLNMASVNTFVRASIWFLAFLCLIAVLMAAIMYIFWMVKGFLHEIYTNRQISIDSPPFLRMLSFILIFAAGAGFYNTDMKGWFSFLQQPDELAPVLKGLLMLFLLFLLNQITYRILYSFFNADNSLKGMINHAADQFFKLGIKVFERMVTPAPDLMDKLKEILCSIYPKIICWLKDYFFDADEAKTGLQKKLWYPFALGSLLFSAVSFIGTSEGMTASVFCDSIWVGRLVSFAIQFYILTFTLHLPKILKDRGPKRIRMACVVYGLTILCSSFFSFTYISDKTYSGTWMQDAELDLVRLYYRARAQIEKAADETYNSVFTEMNGVIVSIQNELASEEDMEYTIDFDALREAVAEEPAILSVINELRGKTSVNVSKLSDFSAVLESEKSRLENEIAASKAEMEEADNNITAYNTQIKEHIDMRYGVKSGTAAHDSYTKLIEELETSRDAENERKEDLEQACGTKQSVLNGVETLLSYIAFMENQSGNQLIGTFSELMSEISRSSLDEEQIQKDIDTISETVLSEVHPDSENNAAYQRLISGIGTLKTDAAILSEASAARQWCLFPEENLQTMEQLVNANADDMDVKQWKTLWNQALSNAQTHATKLEAYVAEDQMADMAALSDEISQMKRSCLMELNQIETAVRRLKGKYPVMAWFSLLLAFYLDVAPALVSFMTADDGRTAGRRAYAASGAAMGLNVLLLCIIVYGIYGRSWF